MTRLRSIIAAVGFLAIALPHVVYGAGFTGSIIPQSGSCLCPGSAPDYGCVLQVVQNLINFAVYLGIILCVLWIAYAGFSMMVSGSNANAKTIAKTRLLNAVVGIAVILCSWIIVDFVMKTLYNPSTSFESTTFGPWNAILAPEGDSYCIVQTTPVAITSGVVDVIPGANGSSPGAAYGTATGSGGGGSCNVATQGACAPSALSGTCFGARASDASQVCNLESAGGQYSIESRSDRLNGGSGPSYSIGLWQINLTTSQIGGLNCPAAFSHACQGQYLVGSSKPGACNSTIINQTLYNQCVAAAKVPANNNAVACKLYNQSGANGGFQPWSYSANKCSVSKH